MCICIFLYEHVMCPFLLPTKTNGMPITIYEIYTKTSVRANEMSNKGMK